MNIRNIKNKPSKKKSNNIFSLAFLIMVFITLLTIFFSKNTRSDLFFIFFLISTIIIYLELVYNKKPKYILIKIIIISLLYNFSLFQVYGHPLGSDPWRLIQQIDSLINNNIQISNLGVYRFFPVFYIYNQIVTEIYNIDTFKAVFIQFSLHKVIILLIIYIFIKRVSDSKEISLFSILLLSVSNVFVQWNWWIVPMSLGAVFFVLLLLLSSFSNNNKNRILLFITFFSLLFTHIISIFAFLLIYLCIYIASFDKLKNIFVKRNVIIFFFITVIFYLAFITSFFDYAILNIFNAENQFETGTTIDMFANVNINWFQNFINRSGFALLLSLSFIPIIKYKHLNIKEKIIFSSFLFFSVIVFFIVYFAGISFILPSRWIYFSQLLLVPIVGYTLWKYFIKNNRIKFITHIIVSLFFISMIYNSVGSFDSSLGKNIGVHYGVQINEQQSIISFINNVNNSSTESDYITSLFIDYKENDGSLFEISNTNYYRLNNINILIRKNNLNLLYGYYNGKIIYQEFPYENLSQYYNIIFNSKEIIVYSNV